MDHQTLSLQADQVNGLIIDVTYEVTYRLLIQVVPDPRF